MDSAMDFPSNPELHNVICMEPRRIPGKNFFVAKVKGVSWSNKDGLAVNGWVGFMSSVPFCQRIWIETKRSQQILSKSISHQSHQVTEVKYWGMYWDLVSNVTHLKFEKNLMAFSKNRNTFSNNPSPIWPCCALVVDLQFSATIFDENTLENRKKWVLQLPPSLRPNGLTLQGATAPQLQPPKCCTNQRKLRLNGLHLRSFPSSCWSLGLFQPPPPPQPVTITTRILLDF